jgi:SHS2 domain-containing protein
MPYEFVEDIAVADIAFRAWGKNLETTFAEAGDAVMNVMVEELNSIETHEERRIQLENEALDILLFEFLQSLIYFKDAERLLLRPRTVKITEQDSRFSLDAMAGGEPLNLRRHLLRVDVKAVTLHRFRLEKTAEGWETFVILDI